MRDEVERQREYYRKTALHYDSAHLAEIGEHVLALSAFAGLIRNFAHNSILDVGAGTGRGVAFLRKEFPGCRIVGVEPVAELRTQGYAKGIPREALVEGNALMLPFRDGEFDWVVETGVLHHIRNARSAAREMCRVARSGVMISDSNNMGQGSAVVRLAKRSLKALGLWSFAVYLQTSGRGYKYSEGDGIYYSFCAFDCLDILREKFPTLHFMNTLSATPALYRTAGHVMILARTA